MKAYLAIVQQSWHEAARRLEAPREINLWAVGERRFRALAVGEPVLFKPHSPDDYVVGGGFFAHSSVVPAWLAAEAFAERNGAGSGQLERLGDRHVSCLVLQEPFFFPRGDWVDVPDDFHPNVSHGKSYVLEEDPGRSLWEGVSARLQSAAAPGAAEFQPSLFSLPARIPRPMAAGLFRLAITELYRSRCALTGEDRLATLDVVALQPPARGGRFRVDNGVLLRADLATLLRRGRLTFDREYRARFATGWRDATHQGQVLEGHPLWQPRLRAHRLGLELLAWHRDEVGIEALAARESSDDSHELLDPRSGAEGRAR